MRLPAGGLREAQRDVVPKSDLGADVCGAVDDPDCYAVAGSVKGPHAPLPYFGPHDWAHHVANTTLVRRLEPWLRAVVNAVCKSGGPSILRVFDRLPPTGE